MHTSTYVDVLRRAAQLAGESNLSAHAACLFIVVERVQVHDNMQALAGDDALSVDAYQLAEHARSAAERESSDKVRRVFRAIASTLHIVALARTVYGYGKDDDELRGALRRLSTILSSVHLS